MKFARLGLGATALALVLGATAPRPAAAGNALVDGLTLRTLSRLSTQYLLLVARMAVDLTYEQLTIDPYTGETILTGLKLYPVLDWDEAGDCQIAIDRVAAVSGLNFDSVDQRLDLTGVTVGPACIDPQAAAGMAAFGYEGLVVDSVSIASDFQFGSSAARLTLHAAVKDAAVITASADFGYFWLTGLIPGAGNEAGEPYPVAQLDQAEIAVENKGLFERLEPMLLAQLGDLSGAPAMVEALLIQAISDGVTPPGERELAFVANVTEEVGRFVKEKDRIVISVVPPDGLWLEESIFASPATAIAALNPTVSRSPLVSQALVGTDELAAAIGGGGSLDEAARLKVGAALLSGVGAPRSVVHGQALLQPLADAWNAPAARLLAEALVADGEAAAAYPLALRAAAGGEGSAIPLADTIEESLGAREILEAQAAATASWPGAGAQAAADKAILEAADVAAMRERAHAAMLGRGVPRSYADAYLWASLAAAAGDRSAASLRERLDLRFAGAEGDDREAWRGVALAAAGQAITTWTEGGLGARIAALYGVAK